MYRDQYEVDLRYLEDRYQPDSDGYIMEQITEDGTEDGKINVEKLRRYIEHQVNIIQSNEHSRRDFYEEVENYKRLGATNREIWGDRDHVPYTETLGMQDGMARENIKNAVRLVEDQGIYVTIKDQKITRTEFDFSIVKDEDL